MPSEPQASAIAGLRMIDRYVQTPLCLPHLVRLSEIKMITERDIASANHAREALRSLMEERRVSESKLAAAVSLSQAAINKFMNGGIVRCSFAEPAARFFEVPLVQITGTEPFVPCPATTARGSSPRREGWQVKNDGSGMHISMDMTVSREVGQRIVEILMAEPNWP